MDKTNGPIRVVLAKLGLDGHDRGVKVIARALREAGMEVDYLGMRLTPEQIAEHASVTSADVVGISLLSGAHKSLMPKMVQAIENLEIRKETLILVGGTIPESDEDNLKAVGVDGIFPVGSSLDDIRTFILNHFQGKE